MSVPMPQLPYPENALEPHISAQTLHFHFNKHHKTYVDKTNTLIGGTEYDAMPLAKIVAAADGADEEIFNNASQAWNHDFFWRSMSPGGGGAPSDAVAAAIDQAFGTYAAFKTEFLKVGASLFGSGWVWLVMEGSELRIEQTPNAESPLAERRRALIVLDVWEHAYYLDYKNERQTFVETFIDELVNWRFADENLGETK